MLAGQRPIRGYLSVKNNPQEIITTGVDDQVPLAVQIRRLLVLRLSDFGLLLRDTVANWFDHNVPRLGASVAFYTLLSLAPLLIIVVAIAGFAFGRQAAEGRLVWQIKDLIGREGAEVVQLLLRGAYQQGSGVVATVLGVLTLIYGASSVVAELRSALNIIWCVPQRDESGLRGLISTLRERTLAFAVVMGIGFLLLVSLGVSAALSALSAHWSPSLPIPVPLMQAVDFAVTYLVYAALFAVMYKLLPDLYLEWRDVALGAAFTSLLFGVGKTVIGIYLGRASIASTYGAAGSLVVLLIWVFYSAQIFFLGAEFTRAYAQRFGSRPCDREDRHVQLAATVTGSEGKRVTLA